MLFFFNILSLNRVLTFSVAQKRNQTLESYIEFYFFAVLKLFNFRQTTHLKASLVIIIITKLLLAECYFFSVFNALHTAVPKQKKINNHVTKIFINAHKINVLFILYEKEKDHV